MMLLSTATLGFEAAFAAACMMIVLQSLKQCHLARLG